MTTLAQKFEAFAKWPYLLITLFLFIAGNLVILPQVNRFDAVTEGMSLLEVPTLLSENLYTVAQQYNEAGLTLYQTVILPLDIFYPLTAGLFFTIALAMLTKQIYPAGSRWRYLPLLGGLAVILDWLENLGVFLILSTLNTPILIFDLLTRLFILIKFVIGSLTVLLIIILFLVYLTQLFFKRRRLQNASDTVVK